MIPRFFVNRRASGVRDQRTAEAMCRDLVGRECGISTTLPDQPHEIPQLVIAVGGDGTVNQVINRYEPKSLWLGVLPLGSANDLATELAIPHGIGPAWRVVQEGRYEEIDLVDVNGARFATCGGLGFATDVAVLAARWKSDEGWRGWLARRLGSLVYLLATVTEVCRSRQPIEATLHVRDSCLREALSMVIVSNQPRIGAHFSPSPDASNQDGLVHTCTVRAPRSRLRLLWICFQLFRGTADRCPEVRQMRSESLTIEADREMTFFGDGEPLSSCTCFRIQVLPSALRVASARRAATRREAILA